MKKFVFVDSDDEKLEHKSKNPKIRGNTSISVNNCSEMVSTLIPYSETFPQSCSHSKVVYSNNNVDPELEKIHTNLHDISERDRYPLTKEDEEIQHWILTSQAPCLYYYVKENATKPIALKRSKPDHENYKCRRGGGVHSESSSGSAFNKNNYFFSEITPQTKSQVPSSAISRTNPVELRNNNNQNVYFHHSRPILQNENLGHEQNCNDQLKKIKRTSKVSETGIKSSCLLPEYNIQYGNANKRSGYFAETLNHTNGLKRKIPSRTENSQDCAVNKLQGMQIDDDYDSCSSVLTANYIRSVNANVKRKKKNQQSIKKGYFTNENVLNNNNYDLDNQAVSNDKERVHNELYVNPNSKKKSFFLTNNAVTRRNSVQPTNRYRSTSSTSSVENECNQRQSQKFHKNKNQFNTSVNFEKFSGRNTPSHNITPITDDSVPSPIYDSKFRNSYETNISTTISITEVKEIQVISKTVERGNQANVNSFKTVAKKYVSVMENSFCSTEEADNLSMVKRCHRLPAKRKTYFY